MQDKLFLLTLLSKVDKPEEARKLQTLMIVIEIPYVKSRVQTDNRSLC